VLKLCILLSLALTADFAYSAATAPSAALGRTVVGLLAILTMIAALAWLARRFRIGTGAQNGILSADAVLPLGPRERLVLVRAGDVQLLVGVAPGSVQHIHTFTEPLQAPPVAINAGFKDALQTLLQRGGDTK
jgi:flagellar protein FliO/FliZ